MTTSIFEYYDQSSSLQKAIAHLLDTLSSHRQIIAIAGLPGSGKSTLAHYLEQHLKKLSIDQMQCVGMDGFHLTKDQLANFPDAQAAFQRRGSPWTFDGIGFVEAIKQFKRNSSNPLYWPQFDHSVGDPDANAIKIPSTTNILIIEGLYVFHNDHHFEKGLEWIDQKWFLDTPLEVAVKRLIRRHQQVWGISEAEAIARVEQNDALNAQIVMASRENADLLITL